MEIGCSSFILEVDSKSVIKTLDSEGESFSPYGHIITATKKLTDTTRILFSHVCRVDNSVARNLAKHTRHVSGYLAWMENALPHFHAVLFANSG